MGIELVISDLYLIKGRGRAHLPYSISHSGGGGGGPISHGGGGLPRNYLYPYAMLRRHRFYSQRQLREPYSASVESILGIG